MQVVLYDVMLDQEYVPPPPPPPTKKFCMITEYSWCTLTWYVHICMWWNNNCLTQFCLLLHAAVFCDQKLVRQCAELLIEAIAKFPDKSSVVCWCSFALLQLASSGCGGVVSHVISGSQLPAYCQNPPSCISDRAQGYLKQLLDVQMT